MQLQVNKPFYSLTMDVRGVPIKGTKDADSPQI